MQALENPGAPYYMGLISGTSMDAVDAALAHFEKDRGQMLACLSLPIDAHLRHALRGLSTNSPLGEVARLDVHMGKVFVTAVEQLLKKSGISRQQVAAIGCHGQTVLHVPEGPATTSIQIADPNLLAWQTRITTVADFRRMDMAAGGQGAPLATAFHVRQFHHPGTEQAVLNIGGMANLTLLPGEGNSKIIGFDTGPGNALLDDWSMECRNLPVDMDGAWAASGKCHAGLLKRLLQDPYFRQPPPKSTGREYFHSLWLKKALQTLQARLDPQDVQATLLQLSVESISEALQQYAPHCRVLLTCGGGVHNQTLMQTLTQALAQRLPKCRIESTAVHGIDPDYVEAISFAWLARQRLLSQDAGLQSVTGAANGAILGGIYAPPQIRERPRKA